jgi:hypothetical protein
MNRDAALSSFVTEHIRELTAGDFDRKAYKRHYAAFFVDKHKKRHGLPSKSDIAEALVRTLLARGIAGADVLTYLEKARFLLELPEDTREKLRGQITETPATSVLPDDQLKVIQSVGAFEAVKRITEAQVTAQAHQKLTELEHTIREREEQLAAIPSVLDAGDLATEPTESPELERTRPWWQRFYLRADPFANNDGLAAIESDLYEQVIIKTPPFLAVARNLQINPDYLFGGGFLLAGGYGHGKTTFIDYLSHTLINSNVIPIRISCGRAFADSSGFADSFFQRLRKDLIDEVGRIRSTIPPITDLELEDQIVELARAITSTKRGMVVFLDDYHKHRSHFPKIFEFLGTLQVLKDSLGREQVKCGFVVSGLPTWKAELASNGQLAGFLDRPTVEMPEITPELVCDVFNRRLDAFCYDKSPRRIKPEYVLRLVREFDGRAGFRDYISKIVSELTNNNQAIVDSPLEIPPVILDTIRTSLEAHHEIKSSLNKILHSSKFSRFTEAQIARCLELLVYTHIQNGIAEDDKQFAENKFYFICLRDAALIQKQRITKRGVCEWGVQSRLKKIAAEIRDVHSYDLQDYLLKLYAYKDYSIRQAAVSAKEHPAIVDLKRLVGNKVSIERSTRDHVSKALQLYDGVALHVATEMHAVNATILRRAREAFDCFSQALFEITDAERFFRRASVNSVATKWSLHPFGEEAIQETFARQRDFDADTSRQHYALALKQTCNAIELIAGMLVSTIEEQTARTGPALLNRPLSHDDDGIALLRQARTLSFSARREDHFKYVRQVTDYLELRLRRILLLFGKLLFGPEYFDQCPSALRNYAHKNLSSRESYAVEPNLFDGLTRSQFRPLLVEGNPYKDRMISPLQLTWKRDDWDIFADTFCAENIKTAHLQIDAFSPAERWRYLQYCHLVEDFNYAVNVAISSLFQRATYAAVFKDPPPGLVPARLKFSLRPVKRDPAAQSVSFEAWPEALAKVDGPFEHQLAIDDSERVLETLRGRDEISGGIVIHDILDVDYISTHYRMGIADFVCALAYHHLVTKKVEVTPWFGSSVAVRSGTG